jgi:hypothetical protein
MLVTLFLECIQLIAFLLFALHKTCLFVTGNLSLHSKEFAYSQYIEDGTENWPSDEDGTENWPSDDDISIIEEMTQVQDLKFRESLQKSKF